MLERLNIKKVVGWVAMAFMFYMVTCFVVDEFICYGCLEGTSFAWLYFALCRALNRFISHLVL